MSRMLVGLPALVFLAGASTTAAPVPVHLRPKGPSPYYHPTSVGAQWVYNDSGGVFGGPLYTFRVSAIEKSGTEFMVTVVEDQSDGKTSPAWKVRVSPGEVQMVANEKGKLAAPHCWFRFPRVATERWEIDRSTENYVDFRQDTVLGAEVVEVPAGKFQAIRVRSDLEFGSSRQQFGIMTRRFETWYASGIGVVKIEHPGQPPLVLKSFTP